MAESQVKTVVANRIGQAVVVVAGVDLSCELNLAKLLERSRDLCPMFSLDDYGQEDGCQDRNSCDDDKNFNQSECAAR